MLPFRLGGVMRSPLGAAQRVLRMGSRWSMQVVTPSMPIEPDGRRWAALLTRSLDDGALLRVRQPNRRSGMPATATVITSVSGGKTVALGALPAGYSFQAGDWVSFIVGGVRFLDQVVVNSTADGAGAATIELVNLVRTTMPVGTVAEIAQPKIEGTIEGDIGGGWGRNRRTSFTFVVTEDE